MCHPARLPVEQLLADCQIKRTRGSGPGGQHRNKVETAIVVEHQPTGARGEASERRSQEQNRQQAIFRLRVKLALEIRKSPSGELSELWRRRAIGGRIKVSAQHEDLPSLLVEALDVIHESGYAMPVAAERLGVTSSQLIKLLKVEPAALVCVNKAREALGESALH